MNLSDMANQFTKWVSDYLPTLLPGGTALIISALIDIRGKKPAVYTLTGALICGCVAVTLAALTEHFGLPTNSGAFMGAVIGFVGADRLRDIALAVVARRTGTAEDENQH